MTQYLFSRIRVLGISAGLGLAALLCVAPGQAAAASNRGCTTSTLLSQPFSQWGDSNQYELAPGGSFEDTSSPWTLSGGAAALAGSEPFGATGSVGASSLDLPAGGSAQSPFTCVDQSSPTFRLFATGAPSSDVLVQAVYQMPAGGQLAIPVGNLTPDSNWAPTSKMRTGAVLLSALGGGSAQMALRFTALSGDSQIDDVFIDPRMHH
jgi:hypothetical protein